MNFLSLIEAKRDGRALTSAQLTGFVAACTAGRLPDYQTAAFLMAIYFRGMDAAERRALPLAMRDSGEMLQFPADPRPLVDKHSTGGVGDKVSLPLAPLLACLGLRVPMISGRGLGITGGTLDKLESIPGFTTALPAARIVEIVQSVGCVICGQTDHMVPADKRLYSLRDVTGTVPSIPLITASILSKKLAESLEALVLDVKFGSAAFMQTEDQARELAQAMVELGRHDLAFAGHDWVVELDAAVDDLLDTGLDKVRLVAAAPQALQHSEDEEPAQRGRDAAQEGGHRESGHAGEVEALPTHETGEVAAQGQHYRVGHQVRCKYPGGLLHRGREVARDVGQGHVGHAGVQHLHERRDHHRKGDDPGVDVAMGGHLESCSQ